MGNSKKDKGSLADQLAGLSISVTDDSSDRSTGDSREVEERTPPAPPSDEELFQRAMEGMSDDEIESAALRGRKPGKADPSAATMGEAFGDAREDVKPVKSKRRAPATPDSPATPQMLSPSDAPTREKPKNDRELFEAAIEDLSASDVYRGKFLGDTEVPEADPGPSLDDFRQTDPSESRDDKGGVADEGAARATLKDLQNKRMLEQALGGVDKIVDSSKYRKKEPRSYSSEPNEELNTELLPKSGPGLNEVEIQPRQRELLKRYNRHVSHSAAPELNLRGDTLDDALRRLELFCHQAWKDENGFVRIIHGKGKQSEGEPVIKPAVLRWLEGPGFRFVRGYAPEITRAGNYGSLVVELARKE